MVSHDDDDLYDDEEDEEEEDGPTQAELIYVHHEFVWYRVEEFSPDYWIVADPECPTGTYATLVGYFLAKVSLHDWPYEHPKIVKVVVQGSYCPAETPDLRIYLLEWTRAGTWSAPLIKQSLRKESGPSIEEYTKALQTLEPDWESEGEVRRFLDVAGEALLQGAAYNWISKYALMLGADYVVPVDLASGDVRLPFHGLGGDEDDEDDEGGSPSLN